MTRKDYIKAAAIIRQTAPGYTEPTSDYVRGWYSAAAQVAEKMADWFAADNPNFNRARFLTACGLDE